MLFSLPARLHLVTLLIGLFHLFSLVDAALYVSSCLSLGYSVVTPQDRSTCKGGQPCTVTWLDDGQAPLLSAIGVSTVGLYTGTRKLVQSLPPVDVSDTLSLTFTPNAAAGPNSGAYYIAFTSTEALNGTEPYWFYSPWFRLEGMTGSFDNPLPSATSTKPIPTSLTRSQTTTSRLSTITVGTLSTAVPDGITISLPTPSRSVTSSSPTSTPTSPGPSTTTSASSVSASTSAAAPLGNAALSTRATDGVYIAFGILSFWSGLSLVL